MLGDVRERGPAGVTALVAGLSRLAPGLLSYLTLDQLDRSQLNGHQLVEVIKARARLISHLQADLYADIAELAHTPAGFEDSPPERSELIDEFVGDELAAALRLTSRAADAHLSTAFRLMRLPSVWGALFEGRIDLPRARVLCEETAHLEDDEAADVVAAIVGEASRLTTVQLGRRLRRMVAERDPGAAKKRYDRGVRERRVESGSNPDGTAELWGRQLPADRAAAAWSRITALARSLRKMGDERSLDQIRADVFLDLLNGNPTHVSSGKGGVRLTVDLTTLMGLADRAGEIEGWGPVVADLARQIAEAQTDGTWEATVTDPETGQPIWAGTTRRRPTTSQRRHVAARNPTCVFPGCTRSAVECHLDHTVAFSESRRTTVLNLGPLCARHHLRTKHRAGWKLTQPQPGTFCWTSPRGQRYIVRPPPI